MQILITQNKGLFLNLLQAVLVVTLFSLSSCDKNSGGNGGDGSANDCGEDLNIVWEDQSYNPTPYDLEVPVTLASIPIPSENPLTQEGVALGRKLFYDPILSGDSTVACASCHNQAFSFTDNGNQFSVGVDNIAGERNAMAIVNLAWTNNLFWDGRVEGLEEQAKEPVTNPIEMHEEWSNAICKLMEVEEYRIDFYNAFGETEINQKQVIDAIAQFERTLISGNSPYDLGITPGTGVFLSEQVELGAQIFFSEVGDCFHCHKQEAGLFTDNLYHNNGLDEIENLSDYQDKGLGAVTGNAEDNGMFRTPTLRNIAQTGPYMHDGRFETLMDVVNHYSDDIKSSPNLDIIIQTKFGEGLGLTQEEKEALVAFLEALTDTSFLNNPNFASPF